MNQTIIYGNVTAEPEKRVTPSGNNVCNFTVAVNKRTKEGTSTTYFRVNAWGKLGDICAQYVTKGKGVICTGEVSARAWKDKNGEAKASLELTASDVTFTSAKAKEDDIEDRFKTVTNEDIPF